MIKLNKTISKIFIGAALLIAGVLFPLAVSHAAATFNTNPSDYQTFRAANSNQSAGTFNWTTSVSANSGDTVAFIISFHNTSNETAVGVTTRSILPSAAFSSATIFGEVFAQNAASVSNGVNVNLTSRQTLTFVPGTVQYFTGVSATPTNIPGGQSGDAVVSASGLNLGNIAPDGRGFIVFKALVGSSQTPPQGQAPTVTTNSATNISQNSATLNGTANPNGLATNVWFEYGTTQSLGSTAGFQSIGNGTSQVNITNTLSNLQNNTTYYFRAVAQNSAGTTQGSILSFTTSGGQQGQAPIVNTLSATNISQSGATLNGTVNPNNSNTTVWFEYGTTQSLGSTIGNQTI